jgi:hypothetical protein
VKMSPQANDAVHRFIDGGIDAGSPISGHDSPQRTQRARRRRSFKQLIDANVR